MQISPNSTKQNLCQFAENRVHIPTLLIEHPLTPGLDFTEKYVQYGLYARSQTLDVLWYGVRLLATSRLLNILKTF